MAMRLLTLGILKQEVYILRLANSCSCIGVEQNKLCQSTCCVVYKRYITYMDENLDCLKN
jgi:hypothetical protein